MKTTGTITRKKPRRRAAGDAVIAVRLARSVLGQIDRWRHAHGATTRSDAVRRLVDKALAADRGRGVSRKVAATASDLAGQVIDRLADPSATSEERATRKRRLIKGPRELRTTRRDL